MRLRRRSTNHGPAGTRIFFATDLHGSDVCFRKFINAARFYNVQALICGGDLTGKMLIPITEDSDGWSADYGDHRYSSLDRLGLEQLMALIRKSGHYPVIGTRDQLEPLADETHREEVFREVVYRAVADWVTLADERLAGSGIKVFMAPGNDDFFEVDRALQGSDVVVFAENVCLPLDDHHEMITTGYSNPTPWDTERELPEERLLERIEAMASPVRDPENLVAVLHPPPFDSELDTAPALDGELRMSMQAGGVKTAPVGSTAVRDFVERHQPLLGLHGHVHESAGAAKIGRTLCINPGSEYVDGVLSGVIVELDPHHVRSHQFVNG